MVELTVRGATSADVVEERSRRRALGAVCTDRWGEVRCTRHGDGPP